MTERPVYATYFPEANPRPTKARKNGVRNAHLRTLYRMCFFSHGHPFRCQPPTTLNFHEHPTFLPYLIKSLPPIFPSATPTNLTSPAAACTFSNTTIQPKTRMMSLPRHETSLVTTSISQKRRYTAVAGNRPGVPSTGGEAKGRSAGRRGRSIAFCACPPIANTYERDGSIRTKCVRTYVLCHAAL